MILPQQLLISTLYHIYITYFTIILAALPLTALTTTNHALAWGDGFFGHHWNGGPCCGSGLFHSNEGPCCNDGRGGYNAGIADATCDHQQNLAYNPIGNCIRGLLVGN